MTNSTLRQRITNLFIKPRQIIILDGQSRKAARNLNLRPLSVILSLLGMLLLAFFSGTQFTSDSHVRNLVPQHLQLQRQYDRLHKRIAEADALNELKEQQIESLQHELLAQQRDITELSERLRMFESILEARKSTGIQLLNAEVRWSGKDTLHYRLTLVKGGNYPRYLSGSLALTARSPENEEIMLPLGKQPPRLPFRMETHTFLNGLATWEYDWYPDKLLAIVFDRKGKELLQKEISVEGAPK